MFKKTKKLELTTEELVNIKLNKERMARAGFGVFPGNVWCLVVNQVTLVPSHLLKLNWDDLKKEILKNTNSMTHDSIKQRLEA